MRVYGDSASGNCYKIKLLLALLGQDYEWVAVDILAGATRSEEFLARNPNGKIPLLELEDGRHLAESNAILNYLAEGTAYLPDDRWQLHLSWSATTRALPTSRSMATPTWQQRVALISPAIQPSVPGLIGLWRSPVMWVWSSAAVALEESCQRVKPCHETRVQQALDKA